MSNEKDIEITETNKAPNKEGAEKKKKLSKEEQFEIITGTEYKKYKLSGMFREWFLDYSSYVILQRAVPHIVDGLKPVQRRVLHAMYNIDNGDYTKVANIIGQAMQFHPHGDSSIQGALVQLGQKGLLIDCQGNWGNILTGDSNAAPRYIEARLSKFAKDIVFDPKITNWMTSYDGRNQEPTELPVRFPLLLAQGTEGIAVGMASKILPHNFNELIDASVRILEGKDFEILPDFPTGGFADCSKYNDGQRGGSVKVRANIEKIDKNTLAITELPYGKTTQVLIDSILKAKDKGKIRIKKIEDMTTDKANILIHLHNDVSPDKTIDALFACTDCETNISPNACVIKDNKPHFISVKDILRYDTEHTKNLLLQELSLRLSELENAWHYSSLERIFFENKVYKILEMNQRTWENQLKDVQAEMNKYKDVLKREITKEDILKLVEKPVRKISKFDSKALDEKIKGIEEEMKKIQKDIDNITNYTIDFFKNIKKKYGKDFQRQTKITSFENIEVEKVVVKNAKLYANMETGFVGIGLKKEDNGEFICDCSDIDEIIVIQNDGTYTITKVADKAFFGKNLLYVNVYQRNDERTIYNVIYREGKTSTSYAKRFAITSISRDKEYQITQGTPGSKILWFTANHNGEAECVKVYLRPKNRLKKLIFDYDFSELLIKGKNAKGNIVSKNAIHKIVLKSEGASTIGGKDMWFDKDIQRLNEDKRGMYLGQFDTKDKILAIFKDGTYYTTSFDLSNRYQGDLEKIEKLEKDKVYTAIYYNGKAKTFYVKRFCFEANDNDPVTYLVEDKGTYPVAITSVEEPEILITFGGRQEHRDPETINAAEFISVKGIAAKGKMCSQYDIEKVEFTNHVEEEGPVYIDPEEAEALAEAEAKAENEANAEGVAKPNPKNAIKKDEAEENLEDLEPTLF